MAGDNAHLITPAEIEHTVDEVWDGDELEARYNFLDYHFELDAAYYRARTYIDDITTVTLFGPFEKRGSISRVPTPDVEEAVVMYLSHRFQKVEHR